MPNNNGKATNWAKNFGRSVKFSAVEVMKDLAPNTTQTATNMSTSATDIVKTLKELRSKQSRLMNTLQMLLSQYLMITQIYLVLQLRLMYKSYISD